MEQALLDYIKQAQAQGTSREDILAALRGAGWQEEQIEEAFNNVEPPQGKTNKKISPLLIVGALGVAFILIAGGVSAALYTGAWNPGWNPFEAKLSPQQVIAEMVSENKTIDYFELTSSVELMAQVGNKIAPLAKIESNEFIDESNPDLPKMQGSILVTGKAAEILLPLGGPLTSGSEIQVIFIGKKFYAKTSTAWIELDSLAPLYPLLIPDDPLYSEGPALWFGDSQLYTVEEEFFNERLDGVPVYHYRLDVDPRVTLKIDPSLSEPEDLPDSVDVELWIGKRSKRLLRSILISQRGEGIISVDLKFSYPESLEQPIEPPTSSTVESDDLSNQQLTGEEEARLDALIAMRDIERISAHRKILLQLEILAFGNSYYPPAVNPGICSDESVLIQAGLKESLFFSPEGSSYIYGTPSSPQGSEPYEYVLGIRLEDEENFVLVPSTDEDGIIFGCNCNDPMYCFVVTNDRFIK